MPPDLDRAAATLRAGGAVAFPTETVYGLGANALDPEAVARIYEIKGRPRTSPLIVHVDSVEMARSLASVWSTAAEQLARRWWPGPLTLVVPKAANVPDLVTAGLPTVGIRMPRHPVALELIRAAGVPLAAPSANRFTRLSPTRAEHVREALGDAAPLVLDGGPCEVGIESTVVSLAGPHPVLLRPGRITRQELEEVLGPLETVSAQEGAHAAPGLHPRHYQPRTPLYLDHQPSSGRGVRLTLSGGSGRAMPPDAAAYAARLYDVLHDLDHQGLDWISVEQPPDTPEWAAVRDRLTRAAAGR